MDLCVLVVGVCTQHHSGVNHLLVTCVCNLCLDKVGMWLKNSSLVKSEISLSLGFWKHFLLL